MKKQLNLILQPYSEKKKILSACIMNLKMIQNQTQVSQIINQEIPIRINNCSKKCNINRCIKQSSYLYDNKYYCWFHKIDLIQKN